MRRLIAMVPLVALAGALAGCSSIINGKRQRFQFESRPSGARVYVDGRLVGQTPLALDLPRKHAYGVQIACADHYVFRMALEKRASGWFWTNLFYGTLGLIGMLIDYGLDTMYTLHAREWHSPGRMMLHEGMDRLYVRVHLQCRPPRPTPPPPPPSVGPTVAKPRQGCRAFAPGELLGCISQEGEK